jgi:hypothetical protein
MYIHYNSHWVLHMFPSYHWWSAECDIFMIGETQPGPSAETEPSWSSPRPSGHTFWLWSWNLQTSLFLACSWPHLLLKLLFSLCYVLSTTEKLLHCLTSTGFNFWLHLFLGANTPETCSVGAQVQTFFLMLSVTHLLHGLRFLQLHTASGEKHQCGCMKFTSRILHAFTWMLVTHQHLWFSSLPHFVFSFTCWLGLLTLTLMLVLLLGTISFLPALQTVHSVIGDISRLSPLCSWDTQRLAQVCFFFLSDFSQEHVWLGGRSTIMMEGIYTTVWQELLVTSFSVQIYLLYLHKTQIYSKTQKQSSLGNLFFPSFLSISRDKAKLPLLPCTMIP